MSENQEILKQLNLIREELYAITIQLAKRFKGYDQTNAIPTYEVCGKCDQVWRVDREHHCPHEPASGPRISKRITQVTAEKKEKEQSSQKSEKEEQKVTVVGELMTVDEFMEMLKRLREVYCE